jgi:hypothetical protein
MEQRESVHGRTERHLIFCELLRQWPKIVMGSKALKELLPVDGFAKITHLPREKMPFDRLPLALGARENTYRQLRRIRNLAEHFEACEFWKVHVQKDHVSRRMIAIFAVFQNEITSLLSVRGDSELVIQTHLIQYLLQPHKVCGIVLSDCDVNSLHI